MKKALMLTLSLSLVLALCATAAFAGLTLTPPPGNHNEYATLANNTQSNRTFTITVTCGGEQVSQAFTIPPGDSESAYYDGEEAEMAQDWSASVTDDTGAVITTATFSYDGTNFHPGQIGDGLTFDAGTQYTVTLTITK